MCKPAKDWPLSLHRLFEDLTGNGMSPTMAREAIALGLFRPVGSKLATRNGRCGAATRQGTPCKAPALDNGRCKLHGGRSSGPKSEEGRQRIAAAQRARWQRWRETQIARSNSSGKL